ncbi:MAG TPA: helix-turn-helix domain-containing protein [Galbitalea sp.]|nr:helix-turn-helix domain-containing protein [Galbitalea sp.]
MEQLGDDIGEQVASLAKAVLRDSAALSEAMAEQMRSSVPIYRTDLVTAEELTATCFDNLHFVFGSMGRATPLDSPESRENGHRRARAGIPLTDVMAAYRIGARFMWNRLSAVATSATTEVVIRAAAEMWLVLDVYTQEMATGYRDEIAFQVATSADERGALIQAILDGSVPDANLWEAAQSLKIPLTGSYVAVVVSVPELGKQPLAGIQQRLSGLGIASIWQLQPDSEMGIVHLRNAQKDRASLLADLETIGEPRVGLSPEFTDLRAVKASIRLASLALRASTGARHVVSYESEPLSILAAGLPEVMEQVTEPILVGLAAMTARDKELLLKTFGAWRDNGGSADAAAAVLFCHPNTVRHRLRRLEEATGRSLSDPKSTMELGLAYEYDLLHSAVD